MKSRGILCLIFLLCSCLFTGAQTTRIPFEHIGPAEGLSESNVLSIIQDTRGFMWFGSWDGLNKFDGYKITVYKNKAGDSSSISNNYINQVAQDVKGNLWLATNDGLNYFDRTKEIFKRFRNIPNNVNSVSDNIINAVMVDNEGKVWIGTPEGLDRYDPVKNKFEHLNTLGTTGNAYSKIRIKKIYEDSRNNIWICNMDDNGVSLLKHSSNSFINIRHSPDPLSIGSNNINAIFEDSRHRLWFGTNGNGLDLYDEPTNSFRHFRHDDKSPNSIVTNVVLAINEDDKHNLWVSTENGGITIFNDYSGAYQTYQHDEIDKESISNNSVYCIYKDNKGNMWLGNFAGWVDMAISDKLLFTHYKHTSGINSLGNNQVLSIMEDRQKKIWIGTDGGGLDVFDPATGNFVHYRHQKNNAQSICSDNVLNTMEDGKGNIWIGTWISGITVMDKLHRVIHHFKHNAADTLSLAVNNAWKIYEDREKNIWIGTYGAGLELLNPDGKSFTHYHHSNTDSTSISSDFIVNVFEDREGNLWACAENKGLNLFDKKTKTFTHFLHSETVNSISNNNVNTTFEDNQGNLWIGTMYGLNLYNPKTKYFTVFTTANGLAGDYVFGILQDAQQNLWISTNNGISRLNPATKMFENYSVTDGVQSNEFKQLAACNASNGMMYFGGINGFNQFFPANIKRRTFDPPLVITNFTIFNKQVPVELNSKNPSPLKQSISETKSIVLPFSSSVFSFEFASLNYTGNERKQYQYMLEGFDKTWIDAGVARTATYTHLDPGAYKFKVRGLDNDRKFSANITTIALFIEPPFWLTWWFKAAMVIIIYVIVLGIYRIRLKAIKAQKKELQKQVEEQTHQLLVAAEEERKARKNAEDAHVETILANAALEKSEQRYSTLFYESPQPKWVYDIETLQITQVNNAAIAQYGYSEEEFLSMKVTDLNPDNDWLMAIAGLKNEDKDRNSDFIGRYQHLKKSGEIMEVEIYSGTLSINNKIHRLSIAVDITEKIVFENKLSKAIIKTQEDERYEIGSELHDNICQMLACIQMNISMLNNSFPDAMRPYYENTKNYTRQALEEIRNLSHRLAPSFMGEMKLEEVITRLASSINVDNKYNVSVYFYESVSEQLLSRELQLNVYRILQEQLRNIIKYANATEICIDVMINKNNELVMQTSDDGIGFDMNSVKNGIGISNMKRRTELFSGKIYFDTAPGKGCSITVTIPLQEKVVEKPTGLLI